MKSGSFVFLTASSNQNREEHKLCTVMIVQSKDRHIQRATGGPDYNYAHRVALTSRSKLGL